MKMTLRVVCLATLATLGLSAQTASVVRSGSYEVGGFVGAVAVDEGLAVVVCDSVGGVDLHGWFPFSPCRDGGPGRGVGG